MSLNEPPEPGYLLRELGYVDEIEAATAIDVEPKTMGGYRKTGIGPEYAEVARRILYSKEALAAWLKAGGTKLKNAEPVARKEKPTIQMVKAVSRPARGKRRAAADTPPVLT